MNGFVVLEKGYEYNDEIYHEPESGGGAPIKIYLKREDANEYLIEKNIQAYKENDISQYSYDVKDCLSVDFEKFSNLIERLNEKYGKVKGRYGRGDIEYILHKDANLEESMEYNSMVNIDFYSISEVEIDTQSLRNSSIETILK